MEIFYRGQWGTVCDDGWDLNDARVVCRQLGYKYSLEALRAGEVLRGSGPIWLDDVACTGIEPSLSNCTHRGWGSHNCRHREDAGVICSFTSKLLFVFSIAKIKYFCISFFAT